jgi:hypothetical protein
MSSYRSKTFGTNVKVVARCGVNGCDEDIKTIDVSGDSIDPAGSVKIVLSTEDVGRVCVGRGDDRKGFPIKLTFDSADGEWLATAILEKSVDPCPKFSPSSIRQTNGSSISKESCGEFKRF